MVHFLPTHRYSGLHIILPDGKFISYNNSLYYNDDGNRLKLPTKEEIALWNTVGNISHIRTVQTINIPKYTVSDSTSAYYICPQKMEYIGECIYLAVQYRWYGTVQSSNNSTSYSAAVILLQESNGRQTTVCAGTAGTTISNIKEYVYSIGYIKNRYGDSLIDYANRVSPSTAPQGTPLRNQPLFRMWLYSGSSYSTVTYDLYCDIIIDYVTITDIA